MLFCTGYILLYSNLRSENSSEASKTRYLIRVFRFQSSHQSVHELSTL